MNNSTSLFGNRCGGVATLTLLLLLGIAFTQSAFAQNAYKAPFAAYLEAECAEVGDNWISKKDTLAAQDSFVVIKPGFISMTAAPQDIPANRVRFRLNVLESDDYHIWGRVRSAGPDEDSFWVRINGGNWVQWSNRLRDKDTWNWREVAGSPFAAPAGEMIIDFAFREPNTRLDKIYVSSMRASPSGLGGPAINCGTETDCTRFPEACKSAAWIEAECGFLESAVKYTVSPNASNGGYLKALQPSNLKVPTSTGLSDQITFDLELEEAGTYYLYFLINAQDVGSNSFWVKLDGYDWIDFSYEIGGADLKTKGFEWRMVNVLGDSTKFDLSPGMHTLTVAKREADTQLDKIYLGRESTKPTGFGKFSLNCVGNALTPTRPPLDVANAVSLYPNPVTDRVTFSLDNRTAGPLSAAVYDFGGRRLLERSYGSTAARFQGELDVATLPAGVYRLVVTTDAGLVSQTFVKR
ncbi:hypothetical protein GGR26_000771 [Lewinella marina]|uniref:Secretion system C-terminal sorting domain-containing protein n=1 Tax=Neolewinella marina TaxID=438751 RepID=A0A2G0CIM9_9BACT|nr:T9SS type A sorting domain-containing protein [Neolewinella marina]NJB85026.1 hypothetical protein [Neolewinella marina]PHK99826.1 hypothetical protein CGL56_01925 [Neolewinella marina]